MARGEGGVRRGTVQGLDVIDRLPYFADELCTGFEVFYSGRTGGQSLRVAFVLCDDFTELAAKLFLISNDPSWRDTTANRRFKNYHQVLDDLVAAEAAAGPLAARMKDRRTVRNKFFHSADLLNVNVTERMCIDSYCDLVELCVLLFANDWAVAVSGARNLETYIVLTHVVKKCLSQPHVNSQLSDIVQKWPRNPTTARRRHGVQIAGHPDDIHLRLCILNGGKDFRDSLASLL